MKSTILFFLFLLPSISHAATSPTLINTLNFSVLAGSTATCTGASTISGNVGVSPGTAITGFPVPCSISGTLESNTASAIAAQAENLTTFGTLDQTCDQSFGAQDLTLLSPLGPGVYCSTSSFSLSGNLNLTGTGVWIFKTVSTLITSPASSITGGDACNVWWRIGSSATLDTTTSFLGNILALTDINFLTGASLNGRAMAQTGQVVLDSNNISGPTCAPILLPPSPVDSGGSSGDTCRKSRRDLPERCITATSTEVVTSPVVLVPELPIAGVGPLIHNPWFLAFVGLILAGILTLVFAKRK